LSHKPAPIREGWEAWEVHCFQTLTILFTQPQVSSHDRGTWWREVDVVSLKTEPEKGRKMVPLGPKKNTAPSSGRRSKEEGNFTVSRGPRVGSPRSEKTIKDQWEWGYHGNILCFIMFWSCLISQFIIMLGKSKTPWFRVCDLWHSQRSTPSMVGSNSKKVFVGKWRSESLKHQIK
jgi:hypothetical protein